MEVLGPGSRRGPRFAGARPLGYRDLVEREVSNRADEMVRLRDALPALGVPVDVIVVSEARANKWARVKGTMVHTALDEGRAVAES